MNREEIKQLLPHREPMLLLDEVELSEDGAAIGKYTVRGDEFFLQGHFPGNPIVPGVIQCEMIAQTAVVLIPDSKGSTPLYTGLNNVKFKQVVRPGDVVETECRILKKKAAFYFAEGKGYVNGKLAVSAEFSFAVMKEEG